MTQHDRVRVGIIGGASISAGKLIEILLGHPAAQISWCTSDTQPGEPVTSVHPHLRSRTDLRFSAYDRSRLSQCDVVFSCKRPGDTFEYVREVLDAGCRFIDLSGDFRLKTGALFEQWYGIAHRYPDLLGEAIYGLPELHREKIRAARLVANPGCYTTTAILTSAPLVEAGYASGGPVIIDAISGVSGAGRTAKVENLFVSVAENVRAYRVGNHQHTPEIEQEFARLSPQGAVRVLFVPHVGPYRVGIMVNCYFRLPEGTAEPDDSVLFNLCQSRYDGESFVRVYEPGTLPQVEWTTGTNFVDIAARYDPRTRTVVAIGTADNLVKGAAGQAVQNMNIMVGLPETMGLLP
ncbi:MAG: N-acetyl-gamma-glutamyl-phosphate reductase [Candidatus Sumerlaeaceae bacterium]|nr:N-acetyl-gamma-glutamyl-phosphate reductase [Candidatus Sumerlaeaceae bacterium]